jgi:porphobilinogen deaminase
MKKQVLAFALTAVLDDEATRHCVELERAVVAALDGDCHSPIGALARISGDTIELFAAFGARDGLPPVARARATARVEESVKTLESVLRQLRTAHSDKTEVTCAT